MNPCIPFLGAAALLMLSYCGDTQSETARVHIHDGDTLAIGRQSYRLHGIDAPELREPGGIEARDTLRAIVGQDVVTCAASARSFERLVAICSTDTYSDLGAEMVLRGVALDCARYSLGLYMELEPPGARERLPQKKYCR